MTWKKISINAEDFDKILIDSEASVPCPGCGSEDFKLDFITMRNEQYLDPSQDDISLFVTKIDANCLTPDCKSKEDPKLKRTLVLDEKNKVWKLFNEDALHDKWLESLREAFKDKWIHLDRATE